MRKRAQRRSKPPVSEEPKHIVVQKTRLIEKKPLGIKKNWWAAVSLIGIFLLVLLLNAYFNFASEISINPEGNDFDKYYLSGPDPYYNMRIVNETFDKGIYPFYGAPDPLLNYPLGRSGARPPLLNMLAIGFSRILTPFMNEVDAIGYSMQFVPALFGALIIFPVYFIGKTLFGKKAGIAGALLAALIPVHIGSGHGSAYSLFDHDSLNLLLFFLTFLFIIKGIKDKDPVRSLLYALLAGVSLAALSMTWVEGQFLYVIIATYAVIQMLMDIFTNKVELNIALVPLVALLSGYLISLPIRLAAVGGSPFETPLFLCLVVAFFSAIYLFLHRKRVPWTISLPMIFCAGGVALVSLYFIDFISQYIPVFARLGQFSNILFGAGIYGTKVAMTIAEANTHNISYSVMSFGPTLYWLGWAGLMFLIYRYFKDKRRKDYFFIIVIFLVDMWLTGISGRFINDMVPLIAILGGWILWMVVDKIDYKQMIKNIRSAGGRFHGLRRGVKIFHIFGILFIALLVIFPNAYLAFDAAVPGNKKTEFFNHEITSDLWINFSYGAFGLAHAKEAYWVDAYNWLKQQDMEIEDPTERPAFISWWDYGFYGVAVGEHPVVADNFQDGIPPASNFHTATSEKEAIVVWTVRLIQGAPRDEEGKLTEDIVRILDKHLDQNDTINITSWIENPVSSPSFNNPVGEAYDEDLSKEYRVGEQYPMNAVYHDVAEILVNKLDDEGITWLYHDIQNVTGYSIRYYGVEGYDAQIFRIFGFLADKSLLMVSAWPLAVYNPEDDFLQYKYIRESGEDLTFEQLKNLTEADLERDPPRITGGLYTTSLYYKDLYFETMFYKAYIGADVFEFDDSGKKVPPGWHLPCYNMKHFSAEFISKYPSPFEQGKMAVVIAKYYEGAYINGSLIFMGNLMPTEAQVVIQKNITHYETNIPIDHDKVNTNNGEFSVIAPAGNITLQVRRYPELGAAAFPLKNITFESVTDPELKPISDEEAMRKSGTNYERTINASIEPASVEGYIFIDKDNDGVFNKSVDEPLLGASVELLGTNKLMRTELGIQAEEYDYTMIRQITTDETGYYKASDLLPGYYAISATVDDFLIHASLIPLHSGNNTFDLSKPKPATVNGTAYYDSNINGKYDAGEELSNVDVKLLYQKLTGDRELIDSITTDENGFYYFSSINTANIPLTYVINASKLNLVTGYPDYEFEEEFTLSENEIKVFNMSMPLALVRVNGETKKSSTETLENVTVNFFVDESVEANTAIDEIGVISNEQGVFSVDLTPGFYNVTAEKIVNESGQDVIYSFTGKLELIMGEGTHTYSILLVKVET